MISIGIDPNTMLVYEGSGLWGRAILPVPILSAAVVLSSSVSTIPNTGKTDLFEIPLIFREDSFDSVTRVRRGRFYERNTSQPVTWYVYSHAAMATERKYADFNGTINRELVTFHTCAVSTNYFDKLEGQPLVVLGNERRITIWTVVGTELTLTKEEIVSLHARSTFGALPEMLWDRVPEQGRELVRNTLGILSKDILRAGAESVIDRARDVGSAILATYLADRKLATGKEDLGRLVSILREQPRSDRPNICMDGGDILAILHPRAKPSEQAMRPLRPVREQDAELAVQLVGTMLCDLGWADWR
ncbi:MAG: hypothetical protein AB1560_06440 [Pseudomonadota bacterium]